MKRLLIALALTSLLAVSAIAGDVSTSGSPAPPPSGATQTTTGDTSSNPGDIPSVSAAEQLSDAALSAFLAVFGLLSV